LPTSSRRARFSVAQSNQHIDWSTYVDVLQAADKMAFETFWSFDHLMPIGGGDSDGSCHECYTTLAAHAALTKRIRVGALVSGAAYRNAALTIKMATQVDVISGGRFDFGIGAGWAEREFRAFDLPFASAKERVGKLRELLILAKRLWSGDPHKKVTYEGKYVKAHDLFMNPQPVQRPRPPILIGGGGEQLTLRVVARHADIWHGFGDIPALQAKMALLDEYARGYGRDPSTLTRAASVAIWVGDPPAAMIERLSSTTGRGGGGMRGLITGTPDQIEARLNEYVDAGIGYFICSSPGGINLDNWRRISEEIIPRFDATRPPLWRARASSGRAVGATA
jgi:alkanesulfonate monooxygenase SsuD/methylene tetrahydromethanopterin reductase-like flavin-dependent oxidoreductase (luciferase family)